MANRQLNRVMRWQKPNSYVSVEEGATKGADLGIDLFYNGILIRPEDIFNPTPSDTPSGVTVAAWSLILDIPPNVTALANTATTGIYVLTGAGTSATREITSADSSVVITNPTGVAGNIDLSVSAGGNTGAIGATFDGGGSVLTPGVFTDVLAPFTCTIVSATLLADVSGDLVISVLSDPYASFPPTTNIAGAAPPTLTAAIKSQDTTLTGWTTAVAAGDVVRFGIVSCSTITRATLSLEVTKP